MTMTTIADFEVTDIHGNPVSLSTYLGKVVLVVNVASRCGFTPQYAALQSLYTTYADQGLVILGFPCNQFGSQEPGSHEEILLFCQLNYGVTFPMFAKIDVNGAQADPFFNWLKQSAPGVLGSKAIKWNFTKFLIGRNGSVIRRYAPSVAPDKLQVDIQRELAQPHDKANN